MDEITDKEITELAGQLFRELEMWALNVLLRKLERRGLTFIDAARYMRKQRPVYEKELRKVAYSLAVDLRRAGRGAA